MKINREMVHSKYDGHCGYCGDEITIKQMQVDHIISQRNFQWHILNDYGIPEFLKHLGEGDVHHINNLMPSCRFCNNYKHALTLERFRHELSMQVERVREKSVNYRMAKRYGQVQETIHPIIFYFETRYNIYQS